LFLEGPGATQLGQKSQRYQMATYSVYYMRAEFFCDGIRGYNWLKQNNRLPNAADLTKTHVFLKLIEGRNPQDVYFRMQGESWSPTGEAREFVASKGVRHTSMSVGDIVVDHNCRVGFILDRTGFRFLGTVTTFDEC
jgi:hypothetical protein